MSKPVSDIAFTPAVKAFQEKQGSRNAYLGLERGKGWQNAIPQPLADFIAERDSFYLGTASAGGRPYIQHRGGPQGFLKVLDESTLAFADFAGNRQYITAGNLSENSQAFIFLMDYPNRRRIKIWGTAQVVENRPELQSQLSDPEYGGRPERVILFQVQAWDTNCPQHIQSRLGENEVAALVENLKSRVAELETENKRLRHQIQAVPNNLRRQNDAY